MVKTTNKMKTQGGFSFNFQRNKTEILKEIEQLPQHLQQFYLKVLENPRNEKEEELKNKMLNSDKKLDDLFVKTNLDYNNKIKDNLILLKKKVDTIKSMPKGYKNSIYNKQLIDNFKEMTNYLKKNNLQVENFEPSDAIRLENVNQLKEINTKMADKLLNEKTLYNLVDVKDDINKIKSFINQIPTTDQEFLEWKKASYIYQTLLNRTKELNDNSKLTEQEINKQNRIITSLDNTQIMKEQLVDDNKTSNQTFTTEISPDYQNSLKIMKDFLRDNKLPIKTYGKTLASQISKGKKSMTQIKNHIENNILKSRNPEIQLKNYVESFKN